MAKDYIEERDGGLYLAGTRISLDSLVQCFSEGMSPETIVSEFEGLTLAQVYGAVTHYLENQPAVERYLAAQRQRTAAARHAAGPLPPELQQRLTQARHQLRSNYAG